MRRAAAVLLLALAAAGCGASNEPAATQPADPATRSEPPPSEAEKNADRNVAGASQNADRNATETQEQGKTATTPAPKPPVRRGPARPRIVERFIPFGPKRRAEMAQYAVRHYGIDGYQLRHPHVIVEHYTATADAASAINTFTADVPDPELHELPGTCSHFLIDRDGTILQLVPVSIMCRHTVGLNYTAIGIEHVGTSDAQVLGDARQMRSSLALTRWLRCRFDIGIANVIGHNESLGSPYHHERVARLRTQTHADFPKAAMDVYRRRLAARGTCGS